jgi:hypothetical protein
MCAQVPAAMAFGGEVVLVHDLNRIPVPPGDRMPVRAPHGQHAGHREFGSGGYGAHFLLAAARGVDSAPWMPGLAEARVINPPLTREFSRPYSASPKAIIIVRGISCAWTGHVGPRRQNTIAKLVL